MNCKHVEMTLSQMIDGEVARDEASAINDHLVQCPACTELKQKMLTVDLHFNALRPPDVSLGFEAALAAKLNNASPVRRGKISIVKVSALAAGLMVLFVAIYVQKLPSEQQVPFIANPNAGLDVKSTQCKDDVFCSYCADRNECGVKYDPVEAWLTELPHDHLFLGM